MLVLECLELIPVEDGLRLVLSDIHERREVVSLVRRVQAVDIAELHHRAYHLVVADGLSAECLLLVGHVLGLYLHSEAAGHGDITAQLHRCGAEDGMVRCG